MPLKIPPANHGAIGALVQNQIAFPDINYQYFNPLWRPKTTLLAAHTNARDYLPEPLPGQLLGGVPWNTNGNIFWQNHKLEEISNHIYEWIYEYRNNANLQANQRNRLLDKIFVWIQIWGGGEGRGVFVRGRGWNANYNRATYQLGISNIIAPVPNYDIALTNLMNLNNIGVSFATKHIYFWSRAKAPIFDNRVAQAVFGVDKADAADYPLYMTALDQLTAQLPYPTDGRTIERNLFSFLDTPEGENWRELRG